MFIIFITIFFAGNSLFATANDLSKDFVHNVEKITQKIQLISSSPSIEQEALKQMFALSDELHDFLANNFDSLATFFPRDKLAQLYTQLGKLSVFGIFADTITNLTFKGMEPIGWKSTDELPLDPADEMIYSGKIKAQEQIDSLQKILDNALNDYYKIAFQAVSQKRFFNPHEKQLIFLSIAFQDFLSSPIETTSALFAKFDSALRELSSALTKSAQLLTKNIIRLQENTLNDSIFQLHEDIQSIQSLLTI